MDVKWIRDPYPIQQPNIPTSDPQRFVTVVPLEWIYAHPTYGWCFTSDVTHMVEAPTAEDAVHVLTASWDHFDRRQCHPPSR